MNCLTEIWNKLVSDLSNYDYLGYALLLIMLSICLVLVWRNDIIHAYEVTPDDEEF